jgi:hypothetical protein
VHGCLDELVELIGQLGYTVHQQLDEYSVSSPDGRKLVFVGDLVDHGPGTIKVLRPVSSLVHSGQAFWVPGNHDMKLVRALRGREVKRTYGLAETMEQLGQESEAFRVEVATFLDGLVTVHTDKPHTWHMEMIGRLCAANTEVLLATPFQVVALEDEESSGNAVAWWTELTSRGGEGMVVKPLSFIAEGRRGVTQPAIKCRGPEYLRIIDGPEHLLRQEPRTYWLA